MQHRYLYRTIHKKDLEQFFTHSKTKTMLGMIIITIFKDS